MSAVTVAIPVRDGGALLERVLAALSRQTVAHELLVCDSGSSDGSRELAAAAGARVLEIAATQFSHGGTRNLLMASASGKHVAFLTQDAEPAEQDWLERLLAGFGLAGDIAIVCGPYRPREDASPAVRLELERWFCSIAPDGAPQVERLDAHERATLSARELVGRRGFFTDANACIARAAWERVPFREVPYAEDRVLALDMLRAGYAKAYLPDAGVLHSHDYRALEELRRCFDEWRALLEVYGWREPARPASLLRGLYGQLAYARAVECGGSRSAARERAALALVPTLLAVARHHVARMTGALLGSRADLIPARLRATLSLEHRDGFAPLHLDDVPGTLDARGAVR